MQHHNFRSKDTTAVAPGRAATCTCDLQVQVVTPHFLGRKRSRAQIHDNMLRLSSSLNVWLAGARCDTAFLGKKEKPSLNLWWYNRAPGHPSCDSSSDKDLAATQFPSHLFYQYLSCNFSFFLPLSSPVQPTENQKTVQKNRLEISWLCSPQGYVFPPRSHASPCRFNRCFWKRAWFVLLGACVGAGDIQPCLLLTRVAGTIILEQ